jgi:hypothetical protein
MVTSSDWLLPLTSQRVTALRAQLFYAHHSCSQILCTPLRFFDARLSFDGNAPGPQPG